MSDKAGISQVESNSQYRNFAKHRATDSQKARVTDKHGNESKETCLQIY